MLFFHSLHRGYGGCHTLLCYLRSVNSGGPWYTVWKKRIVISVSMAEWFLMAFIAFMMHTALLQPVYIFYNYKIHAWAFAGALYFPVKKPVIEDEQGSVNFIGLYFSAGIGINIYSFLQYSNIIQSGHPYFQIVGIFTNPGIPAIFQSLVLITAIIVYFFNKTSKEIKWPAAVAFFFTLPFYLYCCSRATLCGPAVSGVFLLYIKYGSYLSTCFKKITVVVSVFFLLPLCSPG